MPKPNEYLHKAEENAEKLVARPDVAARVAQRAKERAAQYQDRLGETFIEIQSIVRLVSAWAKGRYRVVPIRTLVALIGALVYFLVPFDAVPDFIAGLGLLDDMAVIAKVVQMFRTDLIAFREWEGEQAEGTKQQGEDNG
ncbi:MAG: YkvA family protein [Alcanivoracaceae bacterium]|nr:YkvA family protein [Alcanivoracaceae bacterium]